MPRLTGNRCQCPTCGEYFGSVRGFDRHRIGEYSKDRRCIPAADLLAAGWIRNGRGFLLTPDPRRSGADVSAPRTPLAMQHHCPNPALPETRVSKRTP
jgi:hypothetical protein